jgi:hypothetical protein
MSGYDSWEVRLAWQIARQVRGCPPDKHVLTDTVGEKLAAHFEMCDFCTDFRLSGPGTEAMVEVAKHLKQHSDLPSDQSPEKGQIWSVKESLAGWGPKKLFYNPSLVLVLAANRELGGVVRVAQVYDDPRLVGPGDVLLGENLFAESWNTYTLRENHLERLVAVVSLDMVATVVAIEDEVFPSLEEHSPLKAFRRLELEVGAFFSIRAVSELLAQSHPSIKDRLLTRFGDEDSVIKKIRGTQPRILWPLKPLPLVDALALARLPEDELPLAAAGEEKMLSVNVVHVHLEEGELLLRSSLAFISVWREEEKGFHVGGRIEESLREEAELSARFALPDGSLIEAKEAFVDAETGYFGALFADFNSDRMRDSRLALLVLTG